MEQATLSFIVNQLISKEDRNKLLSQFQSFDKNNDGVLTREEILQGYKQLYGEAFSEKDVVNNYKYYFYKILKNNIIFKIKG